MSNAWKETTEDVTLEEQNEIQIKYANSTPMQTVRSIARSLRQCLSKAITVTLHQWLMGSTTKETLQAFERWFKLKAVMIKPPGVGKKRNNYGVLKRWEENMQKWINGDWESVRNNTFELEITRKQRELR